MSQRHAEVWTDGNAVLIRDLGSLNGTFVNGERLSEEDCCSGPYELKTGDILEMGSTFAGGTAQVPGFSAVVICTPADTAASGNASRMLSVAAQQAIAEIKEWVVHPRGGEGPVLYWFTHPDDHERFSVVSSIAGHCIKSGVSSPRLHLSRRSVSGWDLARLLVCQLSHFVPGLRPRSEPLANDRFASLGEVDENWLRATFVEPLLSYDPPPMLFIIDSLDGDKLELLRPLIMLAMISRASPGLSMRFLLATHPGIRSQTALGPNICSARILNETHTVLILDALPSLSIQPVSVRQNVVSFLKSLQTATAPLLAKLSTELPELQSHSWRPNRMRPLHVLMGTIQLDKSVDLVLDDLRAIISNLASDRQFCNAVAKDLVEDETTYTRLLRAVIRDDAKAAEELKDGDAQAFVDFAQTLSDSGALLRHHGFDFDRKARRLISKVVAGSDKLPTSLFLPAGVVLSDSVPFSGGGFADIYRATYEGQNVALKRLRVFRGNANQQRISRRFCSEALTWRPLQHPNVLLFIGVDAKTFPPYLCMVSPWMENGTIVDLRKKYQKDIEIDRLIREVAEGLEYLHFEKIIHGDLRGVNILVDENQHVRLSDFGLTVHADASIASESRCGGNIRWMAPELLLSMKMTLSPRRRKKRMSMLSLVSCSSCTKDNIHFTTSRSTPLFSAWF
ncbi:putative protein tyrosine kinase [Lyophyllum shimeji]|uniref:Non-specific serine/threonine protein kinase n=1 Tax=Lyophyllum shimeji TaxID=47721 RepID=A0A9P3PN40_LYOSH|nr:putative protein tyrosine kinase [Lyophyllum shimeji]